MNCVRTIAARENLLRYGRGSIRMRLQGRRILIAGQRGDQNCTSFVALFCCPLQWELSSAKVVSLLKGDNLPLGTIPHPAVSKIGVTNPISEAGYV
jgi:hypothetical protein